MERLTICLFMVIFTGFALISLLTPEPIFIYHLIDTIMGFGAIAIDLLLLKELLKTINK